MGSGNFSLFLGIIIVCFGWTASSVWAVPENCRFDSLADAESEVIRSLQKYTEEGRSAFPRIAEAMQELSNTQNKQARQGNGYYTVPLEPEHIGAWEGRVPFMLRREPGKSEFLNTARGPVIRSTETGVELPASESVEANELVFRDGKAYRKANIGVNGKGELTYDLEPLDTHGSEDLFFVMDHEGRVFVLSNEAREKGYRALSLSQGYPLAGIGRLQANDGRVTKIDPGLREYYSELAEDQFAGQVRKRFFDAGARVMRLSSNPRPASPQVPTEGELITVDAPSIPGGEHGPGAISRVSNRKTDSPGTWSLVRTDVPASEHGLMVQNAVHEVDGALMNYAEKGANAGGREIADINQAMGALSRANNEAAKAGEGNYFTATLDPKHTADFDGRVQYFMKHFDGKTEFRQTKDGPVLASLHTPQTDKIEDTVDAKAIHIIGGRLMARINLRVRDGELRYELEPLDTNGKEYLYIMDPTGQMYATEAAENIAVNSLSLGYPVSSAGKFVVQEGQVQEIRPSGEDRYPDFSDTTFFEQSLYELASQSALGEGQMTFHSSVPLKGETPSVGDGAGNGPVEQGPTGPGIVIWSSRGGQERKPLITIPFGPGSPFIQAFAEKARQNGAIEQGQEENGITLLPADLTTPNGSVPRLGLSGDSPSVAPVEPPPKRKRRGFGQWLLSKLPGAKRKPSTEEVPVSPGQEANAKLMWGRDGNGTSHQVVEFVGEDGKTHFVKRSALDLENPEWVETDGSEFQRFNHEKDQTGALVVRSGDGDVWVRLPNEGEYTLVEQQGKTPATVDVPPTALTTSEANSEPRNPPGPVTPENTIIQHGQRYYRYERDSSGVLRFVPKDMTFEALSDGQMIQGEDGRKWIRMAGSGEVLPLEEYLLNSDKGKRLEKRHPVTGQLWVKPAGQPEWKPM